MTFLLLLYYHPHLFVFGWTAPIGSFFLRKQIKFTEVEQSTKLTSRLSEQRLTKCVFVFLFGQAGQREKHRDKATVAPY